MRSIIFITAIGLAMNVEGGAEGRETEPASLPLSSANVEALVEPQPGGPQFRLELTEVPGGAELLTVFCTPGGEYALPTAGTGAQEIPLLSVLRDTLGDSDPSNDRLRQVWVLTSAQPTLLQRAAAAIPFFYFSPDLGKAAEKKPKAVLDLADTSSGVWGSLAASLTQVLAIDSNGALIRSATRRYRTNLADQRRVHLIEGLAILSTLEDLPEVQTILSEPELLELQARLTLAGQTLGGLVHAERLPEAYYKQRREADQTRGHNWELLRQRAEANGLYFDPMGLGRSATHALVWIAREDVGAAPQPWDRRFLNIADPYGDNRLIEWDGYSETRYFDAEGYPEPQAVPGGTQRELIPLALYSLEYPSVPLLLVDFRDSLAPKRREMISRATGEVITGVLGVSRWGNWPFLAGSWGWNFVRSRRGTPTDRDARLEAYSTVRRWLALDRSLHPELRGELQRWLEKLGVNPLADNITQQSDVAQRQYAALLEYSGDPDGMAQQLADDRDREMRAHNHKPLARAGLTLARIATLGIYSHREPEQGEELIAALDQQRRVERDVRFLESMREEGWLEVAAEVAPWQIEQIRESVDALAAAGLPGRSAALVEQVLKVTSDERTRQLCREALDRLHVAAAE